jgi:glucose-1-phosphate adenylyltransferase
MDYEKLIQYHVKKQAELTIAVIQVPAEEAPRYGILGVDSNQQVVSFVEKPKLPPSNLANMGVYVFSTHLLDQLLWEDHLRKESSHDFGKDIIPALVKSGGKVFAYPYDGYWVDVGTVNSYWQAHMDLLSPTALPIISNRNWIIHTRTEERPPLWIDKGTQVEDSLVSHGCVLMNGARITRSVLSPGVVVHPSAVVEESILLTDVTIEPGARIVRSILDKRVVVGKQAMIGDWCNDELRIAMVGKNSIIPPKMVILPGGTIGCDVAASDYSSYIVEADMHIQTRRLPNEI